MYKKSLSWTKFNTLKTKEQDYIDYYLLGKPRPINAGMEYGKRLADALEVDDLTGDPMLDLAIAQIPRMELIEHEIQYDWVTDGFEVPLYIQMDWASKDLSEFADNKTHNEKWPWNQKKVDESGQLTFYAAVIWLVTGKIPEKIAIHGIPTKIDPEGKIQATGDVYSVYTKRTQQQILRMLSEMRNAWKRILELEKEYGSTTNK